MRGLGAFQMAQMKHRDARVSAMCQHLRAAVDLWEEIQLHPFTKEEPVVAPEPRAPSPPEVALSSEKLAYSVKEAASGLSIGKSTIWAAIKDGKLPSVKIGHRTLITAEALRAWLNARPMKRR